MTQSYTHKANLIKHPKRASVSDSKGSMTVEAAMTVPIFLFAVLCLVYLLEVQAVRSSIRLAVSEAAELTAQELAIVPLYNPFLFKNHVVEQIGAERLNRSIVDGGSNGLNCMLTCFDPTTEELKVKVSYKIKLPFPQFMQRGMTQKIEMNVKAWTGYVPSGAADDDDRVVYVTEYGGVYHTNYQCPYLQLSIQYVGASNLDGARNVYGERYHPCEKCVCGDSMSGIYITNTGNKYHNSLNCGGLKRTIRAVKKSEVGGMPECGKCSE